jgi:hypothetical protein
MCLWHLCVAIATEFTMFWASMIHFVKDIKFLSQNQEKKKSKSNKQGQSMGGESSACYLHKGVKYHKNGISDSLKPRYLPSNSNSSWTTKCFSIFLLISM